MAESNGTGAKGTWLANTVTWGLNLVVLGGLVYAAAKYLNGAAVAQALGSFDWRYAVPILLLSSLYLLLKACRFVVMFRPLTDLPAWTIIKAYCAGQSAAMLPGGIVARAALMRQAGIPVTHSVGPVVYSSLLDQSSFVAGILLAALWIEGIRFHVALVLAIVILLVLLVIVPYTRSGMRRVVLAVMRRFRAEESGHRLFAALAEVTDAKVLLTGFALTAVAYLFTIAILDSTLRGLSIELPYAVQFLAFTLPALAARFVPTPGGVGVTEVGMAAYLIEQGGLDPNLAAAAIAIFRVGSVLWQATLGGLVYFTLWRGNREYRPAVSIAVAEISADGADKTARLRRY